MTPQWSNFTRAVVIGLGILFIIWLIYIIRPILSPLIIAALLAYILYPFVGLARARLRFSHKWAVFLVYFSCLALLIIIPSALAPLAIDQARGLTDDLAKIESQLEAILANPINLAGYQLHLGQLLADVLKISSESLTPAVEDAVVVIETTSVSLLWLLVILVSAYYFLLDWEALREWLIRLAPEPAQADMSRLLQNIGMIWQAYLHGTVLLMIVVGVVFSIAWFAIGLPGAIALGLLAGVLTVIPDIGPAIAAGLAVLVALFKGSNFLPLSNFWFATLVFGIYFVLIQIKAVWLRPRIMARFLHLNEGLIFVSIIGATILWGILGALIIVPLLATLGILGRYLRCRLLHLDPWPEAAAACGSAGHEDCPATIGQG
ncbi:MAG TPA: AI-2E family transporter [Anaerolineae bacterium]